MTNIALVKREEKNIKKIIIWARNNLLQVVLCDWSEIHKQWKWNTWMAIEFFYLQELFASCLTNSKRKQIQCFLSRLHFQREPLQKNRSHLVFHQSLFNKYNVVCFVFFKLLGIFFCVHVTRPETSWLSCHPVDTIIIIHKNWNITFVPKILHFFVSREGFYRFS